MTTRTSNKNSVCLLTEDSNIVLPPIDEWSGRIGTGKSFDSFDQILQELGEFKLPIPSNSLEDEAIYRKILSKYIRQAIFMFSGSFSEIRGFHDQICKLIPARIFIISGRYGLIQHDDLVIPYSAPIETKRDLVQLDKRTNFSKKIIQYTSNYDLLVIALPSYYHDYLLDIDWFKQMKSCSQIVAVSGLQIGKSLSSHHNVMVLQRRGVARIGKQNQKIIINLVNELLNKGRI